MLTNCGKTKKNLTAVLMSKNQFFSLLAQTNANKYTLISTKEIWRLGLWAEMKTGEQFPPV